jgi:hypothetical protein
MQPAVAYVPLIKERIQTLGLAYDHSQFSYLITNYFFGLRTDIGVRWFCKKRPCSTPFMAICAPWLEMQIQR